MITRLLAYGFAGLAVAATAGWMIDSSQRDDASVPDLASLTLPTLTPEQEDGRAHSGPHAVTKNLVVLARSRNYLNIMNKFVYSFSAKRLTALFMCLALMITGIAAVAKEHPGHEGVAWAASDPGPAVHAAHHMSPGDSNADCCEPDTNAASGCHVSACCLSELQYSDVLTSSDHGESACDQKMAQVIGPSIDTPLPERPPRLS